MTTVLLDADLVAFRCAAVSEQEPFEVACERADFMIERILQECSSDTLEGWLTGSGNYRKEINPDYKAQRKLKPMPQHLQDLRAHLVTGWGCRVTDGNEADDELGISQSMGNGDTIICTNDKDLLQVPGRHYNPVTCEFKIVSPLDGLHSFYWQMVMGDNTDNIFGYDGKARIKAPKFLEPEYMTLHAFTEEEDMYDLIHLLYSEHGREDQIEKNGQCLYIQRKPNDRWRAPIATTQDTNV
jgi:hypothetical protein